MKAIYYNYYTKIHRYGIDFSELLYHYKNIEFDWDIYTTLQ